MRILLTGHRGRIGAELAAQLEREQHEVVGFDVADGQDVRDAAALTRAASGAGAVVHAAGQPDDLHADAYALMETNVLGTYNALRATHSAGAERFIFLSSGKSIRELERPPAYLPIDDEHPGRPWRPYGLAKWLGEEMCEAFTTATGIATVCLRPVVVLGAAEYAAARASGIPPAQAGAPWNLGVFVDIADLVAAVVDALVLPPRGHARMLLCASDIASARPTLELVRERLPGVPWRSEEDHRRYAAEPSLALVDCSRARRLLGWAPKVSWEDKVTKVSK